MTDANLTIVLASASPRRHDLLRRMGLRFEVRAADVDESALDGEGPASQAGRLAIAKAEAIRSLVEGSIIIAADTLVALDEHVLGKPENARAAWKMLARLCGCWHDVYTGLTVIAGPADRRTDIVVRTPVLMRSYSDEEIARYVDSGDPLDKAGAYAIQHDRFAPVERIGGCYANVMGLPMCHVYRELVGLVPGLTHPISSCPYASEHHGCPWAQRILAHR